MGYLRIFCDSCGGTWEVYRRDRENGRACPHCGAKISAQTWQENILPALDRVNAATATLHRDHVNHLPLFTFDVIDDSLHARYKKAT